MATNETLIYNPQDNNYYDPEMGETPKVDPETTIRLFVDGIGSSKVEQAFIQSIENSSDSVDEAKRTNRPHIKKIEINIDKQSDGKYCLSVEDWGVGLTNERFRKYKEVGRQLQKHLNRAMNMASTDRSMYGVGRLSYLGLGDNTSIYSKNNDTCISLFFSYNPTVKFWTVEPKDIGHNGLKFIVNNIPPDIGSEMVSKGNKMIRDLFRPKIKNGWKLILNGEILKLSNPKGTIVNKKKIKINLTNGEIINGFVCSYLKKESLMNAKVESGINIIHKGTVLRTTLFDLWDIPSELMGKIYGEVTINSIKRDFSKTGIQYNKDWFEFYNKIRVKLRDTFQNWVGKIKLKPSKSDKLNLEIKKIVENVLNRLKEEFGVHCDSVTKEPSKKPKDEETKTCFNAPREPIKCPNCGSVNIIHSKGTLSEQDERTMVVKHQCSDCNSEWFTTYKLPPSACPTPDYVDFPEEEKYKESRIVRNTIQINIQHPHYLLVMKNDELKKLYVIQNIFKELIFRDTPKENDNTPTLFADLDKLYHKYWDETYRELSGLGVDENETE